MLSQNKKDKQKDMDRTDRSSGGNIQACLSMKRISTQVNCQGTKFLSYMCR